MGKLIFLDIDGTMVNLQGIMPESTRTAMERARENGHQICICTGRTKGELYPFLLDMEIDGYICGAGCHVEWQGKEISSVSMSTELLVKLCRAFQENNIMLLLQGTHYNYVLDEQKEQHDQYMKELYEATGGQLYLPEPVIIHRWEEAEKVNMISYGCADIGSDKIETLLKSITGDRGESLHLTPNSLNLEEEQSGEITVEGVHKAHGMQQLMDLLGITREDTIAFGDSMNDYEMIQFAGIGVAMGNATEKLKEAADRVAPHIDEDGLYREFKELDLI